MVCLELVKKSLLENKPERLNTTHTLFPNPNIQYTYTLHIKPNPKSINKGQTSSGSVQLGASAPSKTIPSLDLKHFHIRWSSNDALNSKSVALRHLWGIFKFFTPSFQNAIF